MEARSLIDALRVAERLKDATGHCCTSGGRHESVVEHSWRLALMAYWVSDEFPELDRRIIYDAKLWLDSGKIFGKTGTGFQRINVAAPRKTIEECMKRIEGILK